IMIIGLNFQPWVSDAFIASNGKYGRLLILGESHYDDVDYTEDQKDDILIDLESEILPVENHFTSAVLKDYLDDKHNISFFRNLGLLFNQDDKYHIWRQVAFTNGIQIALSGSNQQPTKEQIETVKQAFWLLIDNLKPDRVLVCSKRMWNYWIPEGDRATHI